ncbi:MAG: response regulator [Planctomycetota bacterium]|nr:response regulator [Planctomycetota bacterium]
MRILIADDQVIARRILEEAVGDLGHEVTVVCDGREAWDQLTATRYDVVISDWVMPRIDGIELCRRIRGRKGEPFTYVMLVSARNSTEDVVKGIMAGANDFMTKPIERAELRARLHAAQRAVDLERSLASRLIDLERALEEVAQLRSLLPICMYCKSIRNDQQAWDDIEEYLHRHANAECTHSICPDCYEQHVQPMLDEMHRSKKAS